jgi:hypothetical protein
MDTPLIVLPPEMTDIAALRLVRDATYCRLSDETDSEEYHELLSRAIDRINSMIARLNRNA